MRPLLNASAQAVVDANGEAVVMFAPHGENWEVNRLTVGVSTQVLESVASYYLTFVSPDTLQESTQSGSTGDTTDISIFMADGDQLWVKWTGADVGATATATLRGWRSVPTGGFRAVTP
jgi:hypothetical protein